MVLHALPCVQAVPPTSEVRLHFQDRSWCADLFNNPKLQPFPLPDRVPKTGSNEDSLISGTMATRSTVRALQAFYSPPSAACQSPWGEYLTLVSVGSGLNGHPDTLHGGIISLLLDETLSTPADFHRTPSNTIFTATMTVDYKKPVPTPGFVLCRTWADPSSEGRKIRVAGSVEDGEGGIYAVGRALFVEVPMDAKL